MTDKTPHFSTFGKNYERRFADSGIFEKIFERILLEAVRCGFVDASAIFIDATHIKASANKKKAVNQAVKVKAKHYHTELMEEINKDRDAHGKKPFDDGDNDNAYNDIRRRRWGVRRAKAAIVDCTGAYLQTKTALL